MASSFFRVTSEKNNVGLFLSVLLLAVAGGPGYGADEPSAALVATELGQPATGLIVQVGAGDRLPALLGAGATIGLAVVADDTAATSLRDAWAKTGLVGQAQVVTMAGTRIPLRDETARILIADGDVMPAVKEAELQRILRPGGAAWVRQGGAWKRLTKSRPAGVDDWAQYNHDAAASDVSKDMLAGPARSLQWTSGPQATGALGIRIIDGISMAIETGEASAGAAKVGTLVARDAYTGLVRWRRSDVIPASRYAWVAGNGRVFFYPTPDKDGRYAKYMKILDLATGKDAGWVEQGVAVPVPDALPVKEREVVTKQLKNLTGDFTVRLTADGKLVQVMAGQVAVVDAVSGARVWQKQFDGQVALHPVVLGDALYLCLGKTAESCSYTHWPALSVQAVVCLNMKDGTQRWQTAWDAAKGEMVVYNLAGANGHLVGSARFNNVVNKGVHGVLVVDAANGKIVQAGPTAVTTGRRGEPDEIGGGHSSARSFILDDRVWTTTIISLNGSVPLSAPDTKEADQRYAGLLRPVGCTTYRATPNWLFGSLTTYAVKGAAQVFQTDALRTHCDVGAFPALGLAFITSNGCFCTPYLPGSAAFHTQPFAGVEEGNRLRTGTAKPAARVDDAGGWSTFLRDARRGAWSPDPLPANLVEVWRVKPDTNTALDPLLAQAWNDAWYIQGGVTAPVMAEGVAVVARSHQHQVVAYDSATGAQRWRVTLDGRIAGAPTIHQGMVLVGTRSGSVYALNRDDGQVIWCFQAAPRVDRIVVDGQLESPWPCFGPVVADAKGLLVMAGRHSDTDGGLWWWRLEPTTGKTLGQGRFGADELKATTPGSGRTKSETEDPWVANISNNIPVVTADAFRLPGLRAQRSSNGDLITPGATPKLKKGESSEHKGWADRYDAGVVVPGNQGLLHRPEYMYGYKLASYSFTSARYYAYSDKGEFAMVGGAPMFQHRGGTGDSTLRACRRLGKLEQRTRTDAKDPTKTMNYLVGADMLWEQGNQNLWREDGIRALAAADQAVVVGFAVTNRDRYKERTEMPYRLRVVAYADGTQVGKDLPLPAAPVSSGIAIAHGQVIVTCEDGTLVCFGAAK
ncbi:MAG: PQQ-binding-like beta-propeller repeat protein [Phycisphaerae bacterium]